ncbi:MAG TPA: YkgJ family cysteine cluster protein [Candidatus Baltobacteraceae bacterium]|jgi:Fe-S-cluster containining protein|nr:YkgJ family cysteine cluster protein [Candidatus Baltobacteraceae bacterium]
METIDLIALRNYTRDTGQQTHPELLDTRPIERVKKIEIDEEHITITYNQHIERYYNTNEIVQREWEYKYNDDNEMIAAIARVIDLARKHHRDMPENINCPPGCADCCSGYEPFVSREDLERMAQFLKMSPNEVLDEYIVKRRSADGYYLGWIRKITDDVADQCVFLKEARPGRYYCGIYEARPGDCRDFTPIGCQDVNERIPHTGSIKIGAPFQPRRPRKGRRPR